MNCMDKLHSIINDKKFGMARAWSNHELAKFSALFGGKVINVSGWQDFDKKNKYYKDYFPNCSEYWISNLGKTEARGYQGNLKNEIILDLEKDASHLAGTFDVAFNHTTLEHIFDVKHAAANLFGLSRDIVILVVPFLQEEHADYGDYWRFTPQVVLKLFKTNGLEPIYLNYNDHGHSSVYIFAIGSKHPEKWQEIKQDKDNKLNLPKRELAGKRIINNTLLYEYIVKPYRKKYRRKIKKWARKIILLNK